jgi:hypothetical protein
MHDIGTADMAHDAPRDRIPRGPKEWDSHDVQSVEILARRECHWSVISEHAIQCDNQNPMTFLALRGREFPHNIFHSANRWMELADDVNDLHVNKHPYASTATPQGLFGFASQHFLVPKISATQCA